MKIRLDNAESLHSLVGKTIAAAYSDVYDLELWLLFTDGSMLKVTDGQYGSDAVELELKTP